MMARTRRLQVGLQERYRRAAKAEWNAADRELGYLRDFILASPRLGSLISRLERAEPGFDPEAWIDANFTNGYDWPPTEIARIKVAWSLVKRMALMNEGQALARFAFQVTGSGSFAEGVPRLVQIVAEPLVEYLNEALGIETDVLYQLARYRRRFEWWERTRLYDAFQADPGHGEAGYDQDLRRFLFDQGVDYPFSQPASASGRADVVAGIEGDDPLVCDLKIFDGDARGVRYLSKGIRQVVQYAHDYGQSAAYLVIVNVTDRDIELPTDGEPSSWPPYLGVAGVSVYLVPLRGVPMAAASRLGPAAPRVVGRDELVAEVRSVDP